jgi:glycosyltransferase involved in cell wall biosynthesis
MCRYWQRWGISPHVVTLVTDPTDLEAEFRRLGIPIHTLALSSSGRAKFPLLAIGIHRLCRILRPRAVLSMPLGWHALMFMGARAAGVQNTAAHVGNYPPVDDSKALAKFRFLMQLGRGVTDRLICCSRYVQQGVQAHFGIPEPETKVIYNGVDVETLSRRSEKARSRLVGRTDRPFTIGMVARLEVHKDQPTLIRAVKALKDGGLSVELRLIGEGSRRDEYEGLVASLGLQGNVKLLGMRRDLAEQLGELDAFVFSAKPDEGLGVALIEAMAARVPIIATDVGACREVLDGSTFGRLVPPGDVDEMAEAIRRLATAGQTDGKALDGAGVRAATVFSIENMARQYGQCLGFPV